MTKRNINVGDHVEHDSGAYLGVVTKTTEHLVYFDGPRMRDGHPVTFAGWSEVRRCDPPAVTEVAS
ncbi:MAG: hypothetical protein AAGA90_23270 [Actinomycetota bacterium]